MAVGGRLVVVLLTDGAAYRRDSITVSGWSLLQRRRRLHRRLHGHGRLRHLRQLRV